MKKILAVVVIAGMISYVVGCGGGGSGNAPNNKITAAEAGPDQNVVAGSIVTLDGSQSTGADGSLITYQWSIVSQPVESVAAINNPTAANPTITVDIPGQYSIKLIVTDAKSITSEDIVTVTATVANAAPVANAGTAQNVLTGALVTLDGSGSSDANGDLLTYSWAFTSKPAGSGAVLSSATVVNPMFTADLAGSYVLNLIVNDGKVDSAPSTVTITASIANAAPVANAGTPHIVTTGAVVTLNGSASSDANGDPLTYSWAFTSKPAGSSAVLSSATIVNPTFTADLAGAYVLNLVVNDGEVNSAPATVTITAVADFSELFSTSSRVIGGAVNGYWAPGSQFGTTIKNISNENFTLIKYDFINGGEVILSTSSPSLLNNNQLGPNESVTIVATLNLSTQDLGFVGKYYFNDIVTNTNFTVNIIITTF